MASDAPPPPRRWRPQFGLAALLKSMVLISLLAAILGGLLRERERRPESNAPLVFLLLALLAPLAVMIAFSLISSLAPLWQSYLRRRK